MLSRPLPKLIGTKLLGAKLLGECLVAMAPGISHLMLGFLLLN